MPRTTLSRVELEYLEEGPADGPLAVCLHGFPDGANTFDSLRAELAASGYRAVAPWLPGYLPSGFAANANYQIGAVATDIAEFIAELAGDRTDTVLIGHDWGSLIGHGVAASIPERLRSFVAMAVPHGAAFRYEEFERVAPGIRPLRESLAFIWDALVGALPRGRDANRPPPTEPRTGRWWVESLTLA